MFIMVGCMLILEVIKLDGRGGFKMGSMEDGWKRIVRELQEALEFTPTGQTALSAPSNTLCVDIGTWYPINGTFTDETEINRGFAVVGGDFTSQTCCKATFGGSGNFSVDKSCQITIGLFVDGVNLAKANTTIDFLSALRSIPASRTVAFLIAVGEVFDIRVKSDTANTTVTVAELNALFIGLRG